MAFLNAISFSGYSLAHNGQQIINSLLPRTYGVMVSLGRDMLTVLLVYQYIWEERLKQHMVYGYIIKNDGFNFYVNK